MEAVAVRRKPEVIEQEKKAHEDHRQKKEEKKASEKAAVIEVADFEEQMALDAIEEETQFPRRQIECMCNQKIFFSVIVMGPFSANAIKATKAKVKKRKTTKIVENDTTENEFTDDDQPQLKKKRLQVGTGGQMSLRRTGQSSFYFIF